MNLMLTTNRMECELLRNGNDPKFREMEFRPICAWSHWGSQCLYSAASLFLSASEARGCEWGGNAAHLSGQHGVFSLLHNRWPQNRIHGYICSEQGKRDLVYGVLKHLLPIALKKMEKKVASTASWWFGEVWVLNHFLNLFCSVLTEEEGGNRWVTITSVGFPTPLREKCQVSSLGL